MQGNMPDGTRICFLRVDTLDWTLNELLPKWSRIGTPKDILVVSQAAPARSALPAIIFLFCHLACILNIDLICDRRKQTKVD